MRHRNISYYHYGRTAACESVHDPVVTLALLGKICDLPGKHNLAEVGRLVQAEETGKGLEPSLLFGDGFLR
ncbi:hypothetical protein IFM47457_06979 [Aspergillus lentulus]|nr:hypothetical protein IFM47457_06979 [Aspergillus lentulus]